MKKERNRMGIGRRTVDLRELEGILDRVRGSLSTEDHEKLRAAVDTLAFLTRELESKGTSVDRLRRLLFGPRTEKMSAVLGDADGPVAGGTGAGFEGRPDAAQPAPGEDRSKEKRPGHGRNGATDYLGAEKVKVGHESLIHGAHCPDCQRGKVYRQAEPASLLRVIGMAPLQASVFQLERLRCNACGKLFTAEAPEGVGRAKYDETATSMIALLNYGCGVPFNRLEKLEKSLGIPLPAATQCELVRDASKVLEPLYEEHIRQAAQGEVVHNDDTAMKILDLMKSSKQALESEAEPEAEAPKDPKERTGVFTSGIVSRVGDHQIALFFTGRKHAGENLEQVLLRRAEELSAPIQMCDALSRNTSGEFETIVANCLVHARRNFVDVAGRFPDECRHVLEVFRDVYRNEKTTREEKMSPEDRLAFHQMHSGPILEELKTWFKEQFDERRVEPNSGLGEAITYMQKHWPELTLFLEKPGAPLDNSICERALKKAILHRRNSLFYKTENGARVGDLFMTLIHTAELCGADPFDYLVLLQRHPREVARDPGRWMPWNYKAALEGCAPTTGPPG